MNKPTKAEFENRYREYMKFSTPTQVIMFVIVLIAIAWWQFSAVSTQSLAVLALIGLISAACFWYFYSFTPKRFGLACPGCDKSLIRHRHADRHLDEGLCPWCGERVWRDDS